MMNLRISQYLVQHIFEHPSTSFCTSKSAEREMSLLLPFVPGIDMPKMLHIGPPKLLRLPKLLWRWYLGLLDLTWIKVIVYINDVQAPLAMIFHEL